MTILAVWALLMTAAPLTHSAPPISVKAIAAPGVTVKIGTASLEEYMHGDPCNRVQLLRGT
jgi:hypothetical protein